MARAPSKQQLLTEAKQAALIEQQAEASSEHARWDLGRTGDLLITEHAMTMREVGDQIGLSASRLKSYILAWRKYSAKPIETRPKMADALVRAGNDQKRVMAIEGIAKALKVATSTVAKSRVDGPTIKLVLGQLQDETIYEAAERDPATLVRLAEEALDITQSGWRSRGRMALAHQTELQNPEAAQKAKIADGLADMRNAINSLRSAEATFASLDGPELLGDVADEQLASYLARINQLHALVASWHSNGSVATQAEAFLTSQKG